MVETARAKAEGLLDETKGRVKDAVGGLTGDVGTQASGKLDKLAGKARSEFADLYEAEETKLEAAASFIKERPVVSLAIASVVGLIIGRLLLKKRS
ncbi:CsbD family protein [Saccharibacter sp. 17.LH.SD]|uniref:CsbD family protein n=1 Tax=Saccharibacter sp. 17.LH.SD TaxID=2689393 RepID=UPI00136F9725|nr:CsbD family protein [Saccharibacter sp. 17.LH.SD]MXV44806.1 CsbD family protein [Saccharibacter sp. 17.LH.SD]